MPVRLFVGGLSFTTSNESLRDAFARFGTVASAMVMTDRETGRSRGFGFVEMATDEEAERAIGGLNGFSLDGRMIRVDKATPRGSAPPRRPGGPPPRPGGPRPGGFGPRPGGGFAPRPGGGGFDPRGPGGGPAGPSGPGRGRGTERGAPRRRGDEDRRPGGPKRGRPPRQRRSDDKGRRSFDDSR
jgi:RNA recognition motif-containing protein